MTGYYDYVRGEGWDPALLAHQHLPVSLFPAQVLSWGAIALTDVRVIGARVPSTALIADQQAAMVAHGALGRGEWKATFGTSGVLMAGTGDTPHAIHATMPAEVLAFAGGRKHFCVEGMVITAGSLIDWLCGSLGLFESPGAMLRSISKSGNIRISRPP